MRSCLAARFVLVGSLAVASVGVAPLAGCGSKAAEDEFALASLKEAAAKAGTVNGLCPVMKKPVEPGKDNFYEYKGEKIGFCCPPCLPKFKADPERYMEKMRAAPDLFAYHR